MQIWVDTDACPRPIKELIVKGAIRHNLVTCFVANRRMEMPEGPLFSFVQVPQGPDEADNYIAAHVQPGDLVVTQDIPLAGLVVNQKAFALSPGGLLYTDNNIGERLSMRNFLTDMRDTGMITGGPRPFSEKDKREFANAFDRFLNKYAPR